MQLIETRQHDFLPQQRRAGDGRTQDRGAQILPGLFRDRRKAEVPGLRLHAGAHAPKRTKESEARRMRLQPLCEPEEGPAGGKFLTRELVLICRHRRVAIDQIQVGSPVMAAGAGQR